MRSDPHKQHWNDPGNKEKVKKRGGKKFSLVGRKETLDQAWQF